MSHAVHLVADAEEDILEIYRYVAVHDSEGAADALLDKIEATCLGLAFQPNRGHIPPELERIGVTTYREVHFKPYRIIYQVIGQDVFVHCVLDGRRSLQELLQKRLLR